MIPAMHKCPLQTHQGTAVLHHSSTKATSGNHPKSGRFRFRVAFFLSFLARQKRKSLLLKQQKTLHCKQRLHSPIINKMKCSNRQETVAVEHSYTKQTWVSDTRNR